MLSWHYYRVFQ